MRTITDSVFENKEIVFEINVHGALRQKDLQIDRSYEAER